MKGKVYDFSKGFLMFITNKDGTERDIKGDENKIKQFLKDIGNKQRGDTKSNRSILIRRMFASFGEPNSQVISISTFSEDDKHRHDTRVYEQGAVQEEKEEEEEEETDYETDKQIEANGPSKGIRPWFPKLNPNILIELLELLILETKAGHDRLYDEMLNISKQLLSMKIFIKEQLDNFVLN